MISRRRVPSIPRPPADVFYRRCEIDYDRLLRKGWPRDLQRVRMELPSHLHRAPPQPWARPRLRLIQATVGSCPIGLAWLLPWMGPESWDVIEEVAVVAPWQRRGVGAKLVRESMIWMTESGRSSAVIFPITGAKWVEALGFRPMGGGSFIKSIELSPRATGSICPSNCPTIPPESD
jgi:hypothetical protein